VTPKTTPAPPSDFYAARRSVIADVSGLIGVGVGALAASLSAYRLLATGFRTGEMEEAFGLFLSALIGAAAVGGLTGLMVGRLVGRLWEQRHRRRRPMPVAEPEAVAPTRQAPVTVGTLSVRELSFEARRAVAIIAARAGTPWGVWDGPRLVGVVWVTGAGHDAAAASVAAEPGYDAERLAQSVLDVARV
jgi:hypothetical protein